MPRPRRGRWQRSPPPRPAGPVAPQPRAVGPSWPTVAAAWTQQSPVRLLSAWPGWRRGRPGRRPSHPGAWLGQSGGRLAQLESRGTTQVLPGRRQLRDPASERAKPQPHLPPPPSPPSAPLRSWRPGQRRPWQPRAVMAGRQPQRPGWPELELLRFRRQGGSATRRPPAGAPRWPRTRCLAQRPSPVAGPVAVERAGPVQAGTRESGQQPCRAPRPPVAAEPSGPRRVPCLRGAAGLAGERRRGQVPGQQCGVEAPALRRPAARCAPAVPGRQWQGATRWWRQVRLVPRPPRVTVSLPVPGCTAGGLRCPSGHAPGTCRAVRRHTCTDRALAPPAHGDA
mmetsp:Transcript_36998/g.117867  ORF Transcript_36998/g.117867 Transcript_36998/m.117867 type:complete len:339 (-) Transcript_36998:718-1734(-)